MSYSLPTTNTYGLDEPFNAEFTFQVASGYTVDPQTGNYVPGATTEEIVTAILKQAKDPNITRQPGVDLSRAYFKGRLVSPKAYNLAKKSIDIPATINGIIGKFSFDLTYVHAYRKDHDSIVGQAIAGYFYAQT